MKWITNIFILILIYLICSARSCNEDGNMKELNEEKLLSASKDSIKKVFEVDSPTDQLLVAYEATAKQKLTDFADYLKITSDSSMDIRFRQQAVEMAVNLFVSREIDTRNWSKAYPEPNLYNLEQLLERSLSQGMSCWFKPLQINVKAPLTLENDSTFTGALSFCQQCLPFDKPNLPGSISSMLVIDIYALKKVKSFGKEHLRIWEVYLGDIYWSGSSYSHI
jgi:hypothetical protein